MKKNKHTKVNGFEVYRNNSGKEITPESFRALKPTDQLDYRLAVNGPHHDSKWAKDLAVK